jgi:hypothetical protein
MVMVFFGTEKFPGGFFMPPSASSRLRIGVADFGGYWETSGHKEISHEQKVCCASVG